tara:strand:+ start:10520 stop:12244 length:1725 start_codon:yes stop_codon:yes gene_type:complete
MNGKNGTGKNGQKLSKLVELADDLGGGNGSFATKRERQLEKRLSGTRVSVLDGPVPVTNLSPDARKLLMYRHNPAMWVTNHFDITLAKYRSLQEIESWLAVQDEDAHSWIKHRLEVGTCVFDKKRSYQAEALDLLAQEDTDNVRLALKWGNSLGKTGTAALMLHWFMDCFPGGVCVTTAGTWSQLKEQLWGEVGMWGDRAVLPICSGQVPIWKTHIDLGPQWKAFGRAAKDDGTFEGVHADYVMVIMDEAKAIPQTVFDQVRRILRGARKTWWVALSTPGSPVGPYYDITQGDQSHRWVVHHVSSYEGERVSLTQIEEDYEDLGPDSPLFISMDCADFPDESEFTIIPLSHAQAAINRKVSQEGDRWLGVDVARFGSDETVLMELRGRQVEMVAAANGKDTQWTAGRVMAAFGERGPYKGILIDDTGVGGGVTDALREGHLQRLKRQSLPVRPINFGGRDVMRKDVYFNIKTEMYFYLKASFREGAEKPDDPEVGISVPNDKKLLHQLTSQEYSYSVDGLFKMVSKDDGEQAKRLREKGEKSPDRADALALAHYGPRRARKQRVRETPHNVMPT